MPNDSSPRPTFGQPGWRRRMEDRYGWDKEFAAVGTILLLLLLTIGIIHAGDETAPVPVDSKQVVSAPTDAQPCYIVQYFLPMPDWSHFAKMPALPAALTPMGAVANKAKPSPAAVAETKPDMPPMPKKLPQVGPLATSSTPAPAPSNKPELEAISPFLQWIKDHPQEAAEIAKKDASSYNAGQPSGVIAPGAEPYWMPPMIDQSLQVGGGGSSATYSTPQK